MGRSPSNGYDDLVNCMGMGDQAGGYAGNHEFFMGGFAHHCLYHTDDLVLQKASPSEKNHFRKRWYEKNIIVPFNTALRHGVLQRHTLLQTRRGIFYSSCREAHRLFCSFSGEDDACVFLPGYLMKEPFNERFFHP